ncbi:MAG: hypothetical protein ACLGHT_04255 [Acidimicrobiia bacterium]
MTTDADLLIETSDGVADAFRAEGFRVVESADPDEPAHLLAIRGKGVRADLLVAQVEYQRIALSRAVGNVLSVEDVIVHKLIAWRARDRDDIASILRNDVSFDDGYIRDHAREWEVEDRWDEALLWRD